MLNLDDVSHSQLHEDEVTPDIVFTKEGMKGTIKRHDTAIVNVEVKRILVNQRNYGDILFRDTFDKLGGIWQSQKLS